MDQQHFHILVEKYLKGEASSEEIKMIHQWYDSFDDSVIYLDEDEIELKNSLLNKLRPPVEAQTQAAVAKQPLQMRFWYAAAAVLLLAVAIGFALVLKYQKPAYNDELVKAAKFKPGINKATLTLSNGQVIVLTGQSSKEVKDQGDEVVAYNAGNELHYQTGGAAKPDLASASNTLSTPKGGQFKVVLPDGTQVWLNAASSITYPLVFKRNERRVELKGEAYFEVAKNPEKPFRVSGGRQIVEVLGTHFNINAYPDEPLTKTTLLEGKVKVTAGSSEALLAPGEQAQLDASALTVNQDVDLEEITAWRNGYFVFNHEHIESIMRKISRWYDIDIEYRGPVSKDWFGGTVSRYKNAAEVLSKLELTGQIHFKIEGRRVIVLQ